VPLKTQYVGDDAEFGDEEGEHYGKVHSHDHDGGEKE
jgi:hypothetical protein